MPNTLPEAMLALITGLPAHGLNARPEDRRYRHRIPLPMRAMLWRCGGGEQESGKAGEQETGKAVEQESTKTGKQEIEQGRQSGGVTGPGLEVSTRDISSDGLSLIGPVALPAGEDFVVELGRAGAPSIKLRYRTVRSEPMEGGQHLIAAAFQGYYGAAPADAPAATPASKERRGFWPHR